MSASVSGVNFVKLESGGWGSLAAQTEERNERSAEARGDPERSLTKEGVRPFLKLFQRKTPAPKAGVYNRARCVSNKHRALCRDSPRLRKCSIKLCDRVVGSAPEN